MKSRKRWYKTTLAAIENVKIPFLHINQLLANKKAVNRFKDQIDVIEMEKIKALRKEMGLDKICWEISIKSLLPINNFTSKRLSLRQISDNLCSQKASNHYWQRFLA